MKVAQVNFSKLLTAVTNDIAAMKDEAPAKLFLKVGQFVFRPKGMKTPSCCVYPDNDPDQTEGITNISTFTQYQFKVGFGLKARKEATIIAEALYCRDKVKRFFRAGPDYSAVVDGFVQSRIEAVGLSEPADGPEGALIFDSGITIICEVQETD